MFKKVLKVALIGGLFVGGCALSFGHGYIFGMLRVEKELKKDWDVRKETSK